MFNIAVCDDEKRDLIKLKRMIDEILTGYGIDYCIDEYDSGEKLLEEGEIFQLVFLDIVLKGMNGIEIAQKLYKKNHRVKIVFQTNYSIYWEDAINKSHAFAFLEKPIDETKLKEQIREFFIVLSGSQKQKSFMEFQHTISIGKDVKREMINVKIPIDEIIYIEYLKRERKVKIVTETNIYICAEKINELADRIMVFGFDTCVRGILVNFFKIASIKGTQIYLTNGETLPLTKRRAVSFKERMAEFAIYSKEYE